MKKLLALVLVVMMLAGLITGIAAAEESDWDYISGKGKMVVGMTLFAPMNYYDVKSWALKLNSSRSTGTPRRSN